MIRRISPGLQRRMFCLMLMILLQNLAGNLRMSSSYAIVIPDLIFEPQYQPYSKDVLLGNFEPREHPDFERIRGYNAHPEMYIQRQAKIALDSLVAAAAAEGINLNVISATRNFATQKRIWENKIRARSNGGYTTLSQNRRIEIVQSILNYSAMPGTSRHHWGTDVDFCSVELAFWRGNTGSKVFRWLQDNAAEYGFALVYTKHRSGGYNYEPWHWSYLPLAERFLEDYCNTVSYEDLAGFNGAELAEELEIFPRYVQNVFDPLFAMISSP